MVYTAAMRARRWVWLVVLAVAATGCVHGPEHRRAEKLAAQARARSQAGDYEQALQLARKALTITEAAVGSEHEDTANRLVDLARLHRALGDYPQAAALLERALGIRTRVLGPGHPKTGSTHHDLGMVHLALGNLERARIELERGLSIRWKALGPDHPSVAYSLKILGLVLIERGDLLAARSLLDQALVIQRRALGENHLYVAETLIVLGQLLADLGDYAGANASLVKALAIRTEALGEDHPLVGEALTSLGRLRLRQGDFIGASTALRKALKAQPKRLPAEHPAVAELTSLLGEALLFSGDRAGAMALLAPAAERLEHALGPDHLKTAAALRRLALAYWAAGEMDQARRIHHRAALAVQAATIPLFDATSERERLALVHHRRNYFDEFVDLFDRPGDERLVYEAVLRLKGVVAETVSIQRRALLESADEKLRQKIHRAGRIRRELASLAFQVYEPGLADNQVRIQKLVQEKDQIERELAAAGHLFHQQERLTAPSLPALCERLEAGQVMVDFMRYQHWTPPAEGQPGAGHRAAHYLAFVLKGDACDAPVRVELGSAGPVDRDVAMIGLLIRGQASLERLRRVGHRLRARIWDPLLPAIGPRRTIWLVPDGQLNMVPFAALPGEGPDAYLIEDFTFSHLASGRELIRTKGQAPHPAAGALLVGGIDYAKPEQPPAGRADDLPDPGDRPRAEGLELLPVPALPATADEVARVAELLRTSQAGLMPRILTGKAASEAAVVAASPGKRIIHLATHGFFSSEAQDGPPRLLNPLLQSGLVLAGPQAGEAGDGLLTAEEVTAMDLRGTELVVLSACDTGLGEVVAGEGVMGLRRAFAQAGARALIMSLWTIPDRDTRQLMETFYERVVEDPGGSKPIALRGAQLDAIARQRAAKGASDPRSWAAFIASGW